MSGIGAMSSLLSLSMTNKLLAARSSGSITDYKGLVCVFLFGGNDSVNMLAPGRQGYADYLATRGELGIPTSDMYRIKDGSDEYHLTKNMPGVHSMYNNGEVSFVANLGTLVQPTTLADYKKRSVALPYGQFSHSDQQKQWQTSISGERGGLGWGGRMLDILNDGANNNATASVSLSPWGPNSLQVGGNTSPLDLKGGAKTFSHKDLWRKGLDSSLEQQYESVLQSHYNHQRHRTIEEGEFFEKIESETEFATEFPQTGLGKQLKQVAQYIKNQKGGSALSLGANRQTFFVGQSGYDQHGSGIDAHKDLLQELDQALVAFTRALKEIGYHDKVVTYTASDFGRSSSANAQGSDHGWGGHQLVMGGPVNGGHVFGDYPDIALNTITDIGRGRLLPTTSVDEFNASLASWYGIQNNSEMETVIPNIRNFWSRGSNTLPINLFG